MEKWLVRTEKNSITGPMPREDLRKMIEEGQLGLQDEVCLANSYWIYLHETEEVKRQLDVVVPRVKFVDENSEETETEILSVGFVSSAEEPLSLQDEQAAEAASEESAEADEAAEIQDEEEVGDAEIPDLGETVTEETSVLSNRAFREIRPRKEGGAKSRATDSTPDFFQASVKVGAEERSSFWRNFAVFLVGLVVVLLVVMVWVLRTP